MILLQKEEILECADGRKKHQILQLLGVICTVLLYDVNTPEYCRYYSRSGHAFKSFGKVCLDVNGEWEVK